MAQANRSMDVGTGLFVLLGFAALGFLTTQLPGSGLQLSRASQSYTVIAKFDNIGGLKVGAPVTMAWRAGRPGQRDRLRHLGVQGCRHARRSIASYGHIPDDSDAAIQTSGLLGANYIAIIAGRLGHLPACRQRTAIHTIGHGARESLINKLFANFSSSKDSGNDAGKDSGKDSGKESSRNPRDVKQGSGQGPK